MENNFLTVLSFGLMLFYFLISLRFAIIIYGIRSKHEFLYTGVFLSNFIIFNLIPWGIILVQLIFTNTLQLTSALSLTFIIMKMFANFNLIMFALRMVQTPKTTFRILNLLVFLIGYGCLLFLPLILPSTYQKIMTSSWLVSPNDVNMVPYTIKVLPIHVLYGLSTMPDTYSLFNTILFIIYLVFYLITYYIVIKHATWTKNMNYPGIAVVYNIVQVLTVNIFINGISLIPSMYNSYMLLVAVWITYLVVSWNCFQSIISYIQKGNLFVKKR